MSKDDDDQLAEFMALRRAHAEQHADLVIARGQPIGRDEIVAAYVAGHERAAIVASALHRIETDRFHRKLDLLGGRIRLPSIPREKTTR
jgi:hypothetical protein